jgi:DNA-binding CsgD family transcriptional regulator
MNQYPQVGGVLLWERESPVRERAHQLLGAQRLRVCATDDAELFRELGEKVWFDLVVIGLRRAEDLGDLEGLGLERAGELVLLVPLEDQGLVRHLRVALPGALLLDRALGDPSVFRAALGERPVEPDPGLRGDPVREAFEPFGLSERQLEVLRAALTGAGPREIGAQLFISEATVRNHLHALYEKVGVSGRRELLGRFVSALIDPPVRDPPVRDPA